MSLEILMVPADDAASMCGISRSLFFKFQRSGCVPLKPIRFGRKRLYKVDDIKDFVESGYNP